VQEILPDVFVVASNEGKGFGPSQFVRHQQGNLMIPMMGTNSMSDRYAVLAEAGGARVILVGDRHLVGHKTGELADALGAQIYASEIEAAAIAKKCRTDRALPLVRQVVDGYLTAQPTPGHTPGQMSWLAEVRGTRCLFTTDFVYRQDGAWVPGNKSRKIMRPSFDGLRDLKFDVVVPYTPYADAERFVEVKGSVDALIDEMIAACPRP
jgi:glyoxylase-like metal-dependent hydrolase (beta-lactamase superfamily II)